MKFNTIDLAVVIIFFLIMIAIGIGSYSEAGVRKTILLPAENCPGGWRVFLTMFPGTAVRCLLPMRQSPIRTVLPCTCGGPCCWGCHHSHRKNIPDVLGSAAKGVAHPVSLEYLSIRYNLLTQQLIPGQRVTESI
jgi:hypothetical protein